MAKWYEKIKNTDDVVVSTRVRLARNISGFDFPGRMDAETSKKAAEVIKDALISNYDAKLEVSDINTLNKSCLVEEHIISPDFSAETSLCRLLITDEEGNLSVMVNEEDHIRIQAIYSGFCLEEAFETANKADDAISKGVKLAFDEEKGFLTSCPTNLGTGLRVSVMLHLPALGAFGYIKNTIAMLNKIGLTVRGIYGEGSDAQGNLYQLSNEVTLGISEEDTIEKLKGAVNHVVEREREMRKKMLEGQTGAELLDTLWRSYGTLRYARKIDTAESAKLISNVRLASSCGIIPECKEKNLISLLFEVMPAHIVERFPDAVTPSLRDKYRADIIRQFLE